MLVEYPSADLLIYPIDDTSNSDAMDTKTTQITFLGTNSQYGNLYWCNNVDGSIISWKGSPHRYYRIPDNVNIPTLSRYYSVRPLMTTFGVNVYANGNIFASVPPSSPIATYVMGASIVQGTLIVIALQDTQTEYDTVVWTSKSPDPNTNNCKWNEILRVNMGRYELPWFADATGLNFICANGAKIIVSNDFKSATSTSAPTIGLPSFQGIKTGTQQRFPTGVDTYIFKWNGTDEILSGDYYWESVTFNENSTNDIAFDLGAKITLTLQSMSTSPPSPQKHDIKYKQIQAKLISPGNLAVIGNPNWYGTNQSDYVAVHPVGGVKFTYPAPNGCSDGQVTATDDCGRSANLPVRGAGGKWTAGTDPGGTNPVGWTVGEWHYVGTNKRVALSAVNLLGTMLVGCSPSACSSSCVANAGWTGTTYNDVGAALGYNSWSSCGGTPTGGWWDGSCTGGFLGAYGGFAYRSQGAGGLGNCSMTSGGGDGSLYYNANVSGTYYYFQKVFPACPVTAYTCIVQDWVCP